MEYPHWLMIAGAVSVAFGFVGFAFSRNKNESREHPNTRNKTARLNGLKPKREISAMAGSLSAKGCRTMDGAAGRRDARGLRVCLISAIAKQMRSLPRHDITEGPANEPNQRPNRDRDSYPGKVRSMGQHSG
jgi:hypothetical protein